jgi:MFS transporter, DHA2 family, methylenomycin A resistance protein
MPRSNVRSPARNGRRRVICELTLLTLSIAVLVAQVDTSVVNLAVRPIGDYFQAGVGALTLTFPTHSRCDGNLLPVILAAIWGRFW